LGLLRLLPRGASSVSLKGHRKCKRCGDPLRGVKTIDGEYLVICDSCSLGCAGDSSDRQVIEDLLALDYILTKQEA